MKHPENISGVVPVAEMHGDTHDESARLRADHLLARKFMLAMKWCPGLGEVYFGVGLGGVVSVFLVEIDPQPTGVNRWLWVVVGDVPSAYLVIDRCEDPISALQVYITLMQEWVDLARDGISSDDVIPVNVQATPENAERLNVRLNSLRDDILPWLQQGPTIQ